MIPIEPMYFFRALIRLGLGPTLYSVAMARSKPLGSSATPSPRKWATWSPPTPSARSPEKPRKEKKIKNLFENVGKVRLRER